MSSRIWQKGNLKNMCAKTKTNKQPNANKYNSKKYTHKQKTIIQIYDLLITIYSAVVAVIAIVVRICSDDELSTRHHNHTIEYEKCMFLNVKQINDKK